MGRNRKDKPPEYYSFEARSRLEKDRGRWKHKFLNPRNGKHETDATANIAYSMLISDAFIDLTPRQRCLYLYAKAQFYSARSRPGDDYKDIEELQEYDRKRYFYLNHRLLSDVFGLYPKTNHRDLYKDIQALIQHGFIELYSGGGNVEHGNHMRAIYRYSDGWKDWKPE